MTTSISKSEMRSIILRRYRRRSPATEVSSAVSDWGYIQIDSISRVERAHHHCLWNRVENYRPEELRKARLEGTVLEYWTHAAAYIPAEDYRFCIPRMERIRRDGFNWTSTETRTMDQVMARIRDEGPLMSRDFRDGGGSPGGWWEWKPAKAALETLFHKGELMVKERRNFQKVFALPEDVIPDGVDLSTPSPREHAAHIIDLSLNNLQFSRGKYLAFQHRDGVADIPRVLAEELEDGNLEAVDVEDTGRWYCRRELLNLQSPEKADAPSNWLRIVSPFDGLLILRDWAREIFDFEYQLECYVPREKRRYGYFSLPILGHEGFLGLLDAKAERKAGIMRVYSLHLREEARRAVDFKERFAAELSQFAAFNGCSEVLFEDDARRDYTVAVQRYR